MDLNDQHKEVLRHMLGVKADGETPWRNYFVAGDGHADMPALNELLVNDFVTVRDYSGGSGYVYRATDKGKLAVSAGVVTCQKARLRTALGSGDCEMLFSSPL